MLAVIVTAVAVAWSWPRRSLVDGPFVVRPLTASPSQESNPAISPDGQWIAFVANDAGPFLYVKSVDGGEPVQITHERGAQDACWSPDGSRIAFLRRTAEGRGVYVVSANGGPDRRIVTRLSESEGLTWADNNSLIFVDRPSIDDRNYLYRLSVETGEKTVLTHPTEGHGDFRPVVSPDGKTLAFFRRGNNAAAGDLYVMPVSGGEPRQITDLKFLIYGFDWSADGRSVVMAALHQKTRERRLFRVSLADGIPVPLPIGEQALDVTISRSGNRMAYMVSFVDLNLWRVPIVAKSPMTQVYSSTQADQMPQYSPDGRYVVFVTGREGAPSLWLCATKNDECHSLVSLGTPLMGPPTWSPGSDQIAFARAEVDGDPAVHVIRLHNRLTIKPIPGRASNQGFWSADGEWLFFVDPRKNQPPGEREIWKISMSGGTPIKATKSMGRNPRFSDDGRYLYYVKGAPTGRLWRTLMATDEEEMVLDADLNVMDWTLWKDTVFYLSSDRDHSWITAFDVRTRATWTVRDLGRVDLGTGISVAPDGKSILIVKNDGISGDIKLVENFR